jgi:polynucleotide 5'-hydroxyl-kinase GRC3/NOL9
MMENQPEAIDVPAPWRDALAVARDRRRVMVLGPTDVGKTAFITALLQRHDKARLIDLDPGQKMIGSPGTLGRGTLGRLDKFLFIGTTGASALSAIAQGASELAEGAEPFVINTAGFVKGLGARLQAMTAAAAAPDLIVEIGVDPVLAMPPARILRLQPSPLAQRKSPAVRRRLREAAFEQALEPATKLSLSGVIFLPAPLASFETPARPVCSLADESGTDLVVGVIEAVEEGRLVVRCRLPERPVRIVRLGKMWAVPGEGGWRLADRLQPSWHRG